MMRMRQLGPVGLGTVTIAAVIAAALFVAGCGGGGGGASSPTPATDCKLSFSVSDVEFGAVEIGRCRDLFVKVTNVGTTDCDCFASVSVSPAIYTLPSGGGSFKLKPNQQRTISVRFCPTEAGTLIGKLQLKCNTKTSEILLRGTGGQAVARISVTPDPLDLGSARVGFPAVQKTVTIANIGPPSQSLTGNVPGSTDANFKVLSGVGPFILAVGDIRTVTVEFEPQSIGNITYDLPISHDGDNPEQPYLLTLKGLGQSFDDAVNMTVSPCPLSFGEVHVGEASTKTVSIRNDATSNTNLTGSYVVVSGSGEFVATSSGSFDLSPGNVHFVAIEFTPNGEGSRTGSLEITHNATNTPEQPKTCALTGTGMNVAPNKPSGPSPNNLVTEVPLTSTTSWNGGDPDAHDDGSVTYDLYFGTTNPPALKQANLPTASWDPPGNLIRDTEYFWRVVARDRHGAETQGDLWSFKTETVVCSITVLPLTLGFSTVHLTHDGEGKNLSFVITCGFGSTKKCTGVVSLTAGAPDYIITSGIGPYSLSAGSSLTVGVRFAPTMVLDLEGSIEVTHDCDNVGSPVKISLVGEGTNSSPGLGAGGGNPPRTQVGVSANFTWGAGDQDGDNVSVCITWGGGTPTSECSTLRTSGVDHNFSHAWPTHGFKTIQIHAVDEHGATSEPVLWEGFKVWKEFSGTLYRSNGSYVIISSPSSNFCSADPILSGVSNLSEALALMRWDVSALHTGNFDVVEATLEIESSIEGVGDTFKISTVASTWSCPTVTWTNKPSIGATLAEKLLPTFLSTWSIDIQSTFGQWMASPSNFGLYFTRATPWNIDDVRLASITNIGIDAPRIKYRYRWPY